MNSRKRFPVGRNTVNHLAHFQESQATVERVSEAPNKDNESDDFPKSMNEDILKATAELFEKKKVYGKDTETEQLMRRFMEGLANYLDESKHVLQGNSPNIMSDKKLFKLPDIENVKVAGATKIQSLVRGHSVRRKQVKFNDVVQKKEFRNSEVIGEVNHQNM